MGLVTIFCFFVCCIHTSYGSIVSCQSVNATDSVVGVSKVNDTDMKLEVSSRLSESTGIISLSQNVLHFFLNIFF